MINYYLLDGNFINTLSSFCSDSVFRYLSERPNLTKSNILCVKSKDAIPSDFLKKENLEIILDLLNSLYPSQYHISVVPNYRRGNQYKIQKSSYGNKITLEEFLKSNYKGCVPLDKNILLPFGDRSIIVKGGSKHGFVSTLDPGADGLSGTITFSNLKMLVLPFSYNIIRDEKKTTIFENEITFKIDYLTVAKNYNCHACWQLFNSILRMIDNPFEQGILRTYINLRKNKKYKDQDKFFLFGFACAFPDHDKSMLEFYNQDYFSPKRGTYGHLTNGFYDKDGMHHFYYSKKNKKILPIFKTKIDIDEKYRKSGQKNRFIYDESYVSEDHTSNEICTERSTGTYINLFNKNYTGVLSEFNIVDYEFVEKEISNINDLYKEVDKFILKANIFLGKVKPSGIIVECIKDLRELGFFKGNKYFKSTEDNNYYNEFNFIEQVEDESIFKKTTK